MRAVQLVGSGCHPPAVQVTSVPTGRSFHGRGRPVTRGPRAAAHAPRNRSTSAFKDLAAWRRLNAGNRARARSRAAACKSAGPGLLRLLVCRSHQQLAGSSCARPLPPCPRSGLRLPCRWPCGSPGRRRQPGKSRERKHRQCVRFALTARSPDLSATGPTAGRPGTRRPAGQRNRARAAPARDGVPGRG